MLEVHEHVPPFRDVLADAVHHCATLVSGVSRLAKTIIGKRCSYKVGCGPCLRLSHAQSSICGFQQFPCRIAEPRVMPKLKSRRNRTRKNGKKVLEQRRVRFEIGGQLKQNW